MGLWDRPWMRVQRHPTVGKSLPKPPCPHSQNNSRGRCSISKTVLSLMFLRVSVDESIVGGKPLSFLPCPSSKQAQRTALKLINIHEVVNSGRNLDGCAPPLFPALLFTHQGMSDSLWPHGLQQVKPLCPSPSPRVCPGSHPLNWWCHPTNSSSVDLLTSAFNLSQHQGLFNESALCIRWPRDWTITFSISPSNDYSGLLSFRIDWFDLLAVQGTLKSFLQHHSLKASFLQCSAFFMVQLSHLYMTTGETIALTRWAFVMMSLLCCT